MNGRDRHALLLAARLLESGVPIGAVPPAADTGHLGVGLCLTERLRRVSGDPRHLREIVASLRAAAAGEAV